ncbi:MAG: SAM-dependent methyltransferase, partial [Luteolibacter sp.]
VAYGNEVLDALPCHLLIRRQNRWLERAVGIRQNQWVWVEREICCPILAAAAAAIEGDFPDGYRTELRTCFNEFLDGLSTALGRGLMIWIDYGFERDEYYHPARCEGTLRTFYRHQAGEDPLIEPGSRDISAHVDFSALASAVCDIGWQSMPLMSQGTWLTRLARPWLLGMEGRPDAPLLRQFQSLTHPGQMGSRFQVLEMQR